MNKTMLIILTVMITGCTQIPLLGSNCGTVTPGQNNACCRRQNAGKTSLLDCTGNWFYNSDMSKCEYKCYTEVYASCDAMTQCETGTCAMIENEAYCLDEDPCAYADCENECVLLESYPVQTLCQ